MMKHILVLLTFLLGEAAIATAQTPNNIRWVYKIDGTPAYTVIDKGQMDNYGNSFLLEWYEPNSPSIDSIYIYLAKVNPMGNLLWRKHIITQSLPIGYFNMPADWLHFTMDVDGDFYIASSSFFASSVFINHPTNIQAPNYQGNDYLWVAKWSHEGELQWFKHTTPSGNNAGGRFISDLLTDQSDAVYVYGSFYGTQDFDPGSSTSIQSSVGGLYVPNPFLWKLGASGNFGWLNNFGGNIGGPMATLSAGQYSSTPINNMTISLPKRMEGAASEQRIFIIGSVQHSSDFDPGPNVTTVDSGSFMAEYQTNGNLVWAGNLNDQNATNIFNLQGVAMDSSNNVYLTGGYWRSPNIAGPNATSNYYLPDNYIGSAGHFSSNSDAFVAKLDSAGNVDWAKVIKRDSTQGLVITGIPVVNDSNQLYIPGNISCNNCTINFNTTTNPVTVTTASQQDGFVLKLAANTGNFDWLYRTHGIQNSQGCFISSSAIDQYNNVFVTGGVWGGASFNMSGPPNIWYPMGGGGSFLIKLGHCPAVVDSAAAGACHSYFIGGQSLDSSGFYAVVLPASSGNCDSIVALTLTVQPINDSILRSGDTLIAQSANASYQWLHCDNGSYTVIAGATSQRYLPFSPGHYAVAIAYQDCHDTSECFDVQTLGIRNALQEKEIRIFPNPVSRQFEIVFGEEVQQVQLSLVNTLGEVVWKQANFSGKTKQVDVSGFSSGVYYLLIQDGGSVKAEKVVKW